MTLSWKMLDFQFICVYLADKNVAQLSCYNFPFAHYHSHWPTHTRYELSDTVFILGDNLAI